MAAKRSAKVRARKVQVVRGAKKAGKLDVSAFERSAARAFRRAVQKEYELLAKRGIPTVVVIDGETVRGVPRKIGGRYIVRKS